MGSLFTFKRLVPKGNGRLSRIEHLVDIHSRVLENIEVEGRLSIRRTANGSFVISSRSSCGAPDTDFTPSKFLQSWSLLEIRPRLTIRRRSRLLFSAAQRKPLAAWNGYIKIMLPAAHIRLLRASQMASIFGFDLMCGTKTQCLFWRGNNIFSMDFHCRIKKKKTRNF